MSCFKIYLHANKKTRDYMNFWNKRNVTARHITI